MVKVFDKYDDVAPSLGGGFNLNGGAATLREMGLWNELLAVCNPMERVHSRTISGVTLFDISIPKILPKDLVFDGTPCAFTVMRSDLTRLLADHLPQGVVQVGSEVTGVKETAEGISAVYADGSLSEEFDLLVGCDGIRSVVRQAIQKTSSPPRYSGIRIQLGTAPLGSLSKSPSEVQQWFGNGAYALCYS
ncbi:hypothetical protein CYMTET_54605, partial [Cymbomonas tetramitiformis]